MTEGATTTLLVLFGVGLVVWLLVKRQQPATVPNTQPMSPTGGGGDIYTKGANLIYRAISNPDSIQHDFGLPGVDGFTGKGIFEAGSYPNLSPDQQLYYTWSSAARVAQQTDKQDEARRRLNYSVAIAILPAQRLGTCCDFDPQMVLAKGGGHAQYIGNYRVSFNRTDIGSHPPGKQITATMVQTIPPMDYYVGITEEYRIKAGIPLYQGVIPYNT